MAVTPLDFETPEGKSEKWSGVGAYEIHDQTAKGEAAVDTLRKYYVAKHRL